MKSQTGVFVLKSLSGTLKVTNEGDCVRQIQIEESVDLELCVVM